jgi:ABC-type lipopolysaccharide export system ATPase subunit
MPGQIVLDGKGHHRRSDVCARQDGVGYLPQEPSVFRKLSVAD